MAGGFKFNFGHGALGNESDNVLHVSENDKSVGNESSNVACQTVSFKDHTAEICQKLPSIQKLIATTSLSSINLGSESVGERRPSMLWHLDQASVNNLLEARNSPVVSPSNLCELVKHSDLSSGVYEGGFKIWECSIDLVKYLASSDTDLQGKDVLELGCGAGLPSLYCLLSGAKFVGFQDFNAEVIDYFTAPNIICNLKMETPDMSDEDLYAILNGKTVLLSGDWTDVCKYLETKKRKFDLILSSETIYNTENYGKLHQLICKSLKEDGKALLANKSYYFGVGGSSKDFIKYVERENKLDPKIVSHIDKGVNREIVQVCWKD